MKIWLLSYLHLEFDRTWDLPHWCVDMTVGATRVVASPRGYPDEPNLEFYPGLIIEI